MKYDLNSEVIGSLLLKMTKRKIAFYIKIYSTIWPAGCGARVLDNMQQVAQPGNIVGGGGGWDTLCSQILVKETQIVEGEKGKCTNCQQRR